MPLTNVEKKKILDRLRVECDYDELTEYDDQTPVSFSDRVKQDMAVIVEQGLNKDCPNWGENFRKLLHSKKFKFEEIADRMGIHHASVIDALKKNTADPFYLEAFSLIFQVSPYTLLGLKVPRLVSPMSYWVDSKKGFSNVVMNTYCEYEKSGNLQYAKDLVKVGKLLPDAYKKFLIQGRKKKKFRIAFLNKPSDSPLYYDSSWMNQVTSRMEALNKALTKNDKEQQDIHRSFIEAHLVVQDLERKSPVRLIQLAQLSLSQNLRFEFTLDGKTPIDHTQFQEYAIIELFLQPGKSKKSDLLNTDNVHPNIDTENDADANSAVESHEKLRGQKLYYCDLLDL